MAERQIQSAARLSEDIGDVLTAIRRLIAELPDAEVNGTLSPLSRAALRIETRLATAEPARLDTARLDSLSRALARLSDLVTETYLT